MKVTDVKVRIARKKTQENLIAYADVTFNEAFVLHGLKVMEGQNGMFVAMPSRRMPSGEFKDIAHPIKPDLRQEITDAVAAKYQESYTISENSQEELQ